MCAYDQIHGSGEWPYHLAARLARELWALIDDVFPGLQCEHPDVSVLCNNCGVRLGSLLGLAGRFSEVEVSCDACRHAHLLEPYVGVAAGATTHTDAAWEYWYRNVSSIKIEHHRKRCLIDVAKALFRCAPAWEGVPKLWAPIPGESSSTPFAWTLRPMCAHRGCLHVMVSDRHPALVSSMASFWDTLRSLDSDARANMRTWLIRVSKTMQLCASTQPDALQQTVSGEELYRSREHFIVEYRFPHRVSASNALGARDIVSTLAQLFAELDHANLRRVRDGGLGNIFVCDQHAPFYTLREGSVDSLRSMVQQMQQLMQQQMQQLMQQQIAETARHQAALAQMRAKLDAAARRQNAHHEHGRNPRMFVLRLAPTTTPVHAISGKVTCHLYLLCEHGGMPHPVKFRDTNEWRRIELGIPNKTLRAMGPGLKAMKFLCQAASVAFGAASTLASFLRDDLPDTE